LDEFIPFVGNIQNYSFIYEYNHATTTFNKSGLNSPFPSDGHAAGVANTMYVNLGVDYKATNDITLSADAYGFWAAETGAWEDAVGDHDVSSNAGWEIDASLNTKLQGTSSTRSTQVTSNQAVSMKMLMILIQKA